MPSAGSNVPVVMCPGMIVLVTISLDSSVTYARGLTRVLGLTLTRAVAESAVLLWTVAPARA